MQQRCGSIVSNSDIPGIGVVNVVAVGTPLANSLIHAE
jgi:hypothetical protein